MNRDAASDKTSQAASPEIRSRLPWRRRSGADLEVSSSSMPEVDPEDAIRRCDRACSSSLPILAAASGVMLLLSLLLSSQPLDSVAGIFAACISGLTGVILLIGAWNLSRQSVDARSGHQTAVVILLVTSLSLSIAMIAGGTLAQSAYVELLIVVSGAVMLSARWLLAALGGLWALWLGVAAILSGTVSSGGWFLAMIGATVVSVAIHLMRVEGVRALSVALSAAEADAVEDVLTGLLNRRGLRVVGAEMLAISQRSREAIACTFIDVDGLKIVNDVRGHDAGDDVLVTVSEALKDVFRESDVLARWGGDEFVVLSMGSGPSVDDVERRLTNRLQSMDRTAFGERTSGVSAGRVVHMPWQDENLEQILERADQEMYRRRRLRRAQIRDSEQI